MACKAMFCRLLSEYEALMPTYLGVDPDPQMIVKTGGPGPSV